MRHPFGGGPDAIVVDPATGRPRPGANGTMWTAKTGGVQVTDLRTADGSTALPGGVVTADTRGLIAFLGPDDGSADPLSGAEELWADFGAGRHRLLAADMHSQIGVLDARIAPVAAAVTALSTRVSTLEASRGQPGGLATLDATALIPYAQLPAYPVGATVLSDLTDVDTGGASRGTALVFDGTQWRPGFPGPAASAKVNVPNPLIVASRGGAGVYPQNTLDAARAAAAGGWALDVTCSVTADGIVVAIQTPVDANTTLTGPTTSLYHAALTRPVADASAWFGPGWPDGPVPTLQEILETVAGRTIVFVECQTALAVTKAVAVIQRLRMSDNVVIESFGQPDLAPAAAAAMECMLLHANGSGLTPATLLAAGIRWVGIGTSAAPATITGLLNGGLKVIMWTVDRHTDRATWAALGVHGYFTNHPQYLNTDPAAYRRSTDPFRGKTWPPGFVAAPAGGWQFSTFDNLQTIAGTAWSQRTALQGWACPLANPSGFTITFSVLYDQLTGPNTNGVIIALSPIDKAWARANTDVGYEIVISYAGVISLFKRSGSATVAGPTVTTGSGAFGAAPLTYQFQIQVNATNITVTRLVGTTAPNSVTWADNTYQGNYLHIGHTGLANTQQLQIGSISIT